MSDLTHNPVAALIDEWQADRRAIAEIEAADHPDITDALGRTWTWKPSGSGDLYTHDGMTWPRTHIENPNVGWPTPYALNSPNYRWCDLCKGAVNV